MEREGIGLSRRLDPKERRDSPSTSKRAFNVAGNESRRLKFRRERERERRARFNSEEDGVSRLSRACTFKVEKKKKRKRKPFSKGRSFVEWQ